MLRRQSSQAEVIRLLAADPRLTAANLKKVANELGIDVPPAMRAKTSLQLHIAERLHDLMVGLVNSPRTRRT